MYTSLIVRSLHTLLQWNQDSHILRQPLKHPYIWTFTPLSNQGVRRIHVPINNKHYTNFIQHPIPFEISYYFTKYIHSCTSRREFDVCDYGYMYTSSKRIWPHVEYIITLGEISIYAMRASSTSSCFQQLSTYYNIQQKHTYTSIPQKAKPFHTPHFILSYNAPSITLPTIIQNTIPIYYSHILCTIKSTR